MDNSIACPFCGLPEARVMVRNQLAIACCDTFPVTQGHTLVIPVRHLPSLFDTTADERIAMFELLEEAKRQIQAEFAPAGYNIGIDDGATARQTVGHLHVHLIPRYPGDRPDTRGGIRWVIPEKADYLTGQR